jgi:hypothetical protein
LIAQRELQAIISGFEPGLLQRTLQLRLLALQKTQRLGTVDVDMRRHLAVAVDIEPHVNGAELGRVEPDFELIGAGLRMRDDRDG